MSQLAQVAEIAGVSTADVVRVASEGGSSRADWAIAHAIEQVTNRPAADIMWAGASRETRHTPATTPTNPAAKHDRTVRIYPENTSPEDANRIAPHHPGDDTPERDEADEDTQVDELTAEVFSDLADLIGLVPALRMTTAWTTPRTARTELHRLLATHPRTRDRFAVEDFAAAA